MESLGDWANASIHAGSTRDVQRSYEHHSLTSPSVPALINHGFSRCQAISSTPKPSTTRCPLRIFSGTIKGFSMRSEYIVQWKTWIVPSSEEDAKSGRVGW